MQNYMLDTIMGLPKQSPGWVWDLMVLELVLEDELVEHSYTVVIVVVPQSALHLHDCVCSFSITNGMVYRE